MNKCFEQGRWTRDLELTFTKGTGMAVARGTLAVDRKVAKDKEKTTDFIPVVLFGTLAENTANYCGSKGDRIAIFGHLQSGKRQDKKHAEVTHYTLDLIADDVEFLETKKSNNTAPAADSTEEMTLMDDNECPF